MPRDIECSTVGMLYQNRSWTRTGVPRKNQMYVQATADTIGFGDRRMTASRIPSTMPIAMAMAVSIRVFSTPCRIELSNRYCRTTDQLISGLVINQCSSCATSTRMIAADTQRPGCRTGTAVMISGRLAAVVGSLTVIVGSARRPVDGEVRDGAAARRPTS